MQALISKQEPRCTGYRVAQVVQDHEVFIVAEPMLFWWPCEDHVEADTYWWCPETQTLLPMPPPEPLILDIATTTTTTTASGLEPF